MWWDARDAFWGFQEYRTCIGCWVLRIANRIRVTDLFLFYFTGFRLILLAISRGATTSRMPAILSLRGIPALTQHRVGTDRTHNTSESKRNAAKNDEMQQQKKKLLRWPKRLPFSSTGSFFYFFIARSLRVCVLVSHWSATVMRVLVMEGGGRGGLVSFHEFFRGKIGAANPISQQKRRRRRRNSRRSSFFLLLLSFFLSAIYFYHFHEKRT